MARLERPREDYPAAVATVLQAAAVPYGVTLTVWGSGALVMHFRGSPKVFEVFLFVLGGITGYTLVSLTRARAIREQPPAPPGSHMVLTGMLHVLSIGVALGSVALVGRIDGWVAWPLGGLCGIALYLLLVGVEYGLALALVLDPDGRVTGEDEKTP